MTTTAKTAAEARRDELADLAEAAGHTVERNNRTDDIGPVFELVVRGRHEVVQVIVRQSKFVTRSSLWAQKWNHGERPTRLGAREVTALIRRMTPAEQAAPTPEAAPKPADDRITFRRVTADVYVNDETGVKIIRIDGIWHVQALGERPKTGGNRDRMIDNVMPFAHTVVRAVRIETAAAAAGVQPHELTDAQREAAARTPIAPAGERTERTLREVVRLFVAAHVEPVGRLKIRAAVDNAHGQRPVDGYPATAAAGDRAAAIAAVLDELVAAGELTQQGYGRQAYYLAPTGEAPEYPVDVDGVPVPVGALVECVGDETGTMTGKRGRVQESTTEADGPGRLAIRIFPAGRRDFDHIRSANRVRVIELPDGAEWPTAPAVTVVADEAADLLGADTATISDRLTALVRASRDSSLPAATVAEALGELGFIHGPHDRYAHKSGAELIKFGTGRWIMYVPKVDGDGRRVWAEADELVDLVGSAYDYLNGPQEVAGPVDGFARGDIVQWGGNGHAAARKWRIASLHVPRDGSEPYAGLDLLNDPGPGTTHTAGRLSLLVHVDDVMPGDDRQVDPAAAAGCAAVLADPKTHGGKVEPYLFRGPIGEHTEMLCEVHGACTGARPVDPTKINKPAPATDRELVAAAFGPIVDAMADQADPHAGDKTAPPADDQGAELERLRAAVELHRPYLLDKYGHETTDQAAAKWIRCRECQCSVPLTGCKTWQTAHPE